MSLTWDEVNALYVTHHAIERFQERYRCESNNPERTIRRLLKGASLDQVPTRRLLRSIAMDRDTARFYRTADGYRIVVADGAVVTFEIPNDAPQRLRRARAEK